MVARPPASWVEVVPSHLKRWMGSVLCYTCLPTALVVTARWSGGKILLGTLSMDLISHAESVIYLYISMSITYWVSMNKLLIVSSLYACKKCKMLAAIFSGTEHHGVESSVISWRTASIPYLVNHTKVVRFGRPLIGLPNMFMIQCIGSDYPFYRLVESLTEGCPHFGDTSSWCNGSHFGCWLIAINTRIKG